jgi:hypothetical protein
VVNMRKVRGHFLGTEVPIGWYKGERVVSPDGKR